MRIGMIFGALFALVIGTEAAFAGSVTEIPFKKMDGKETTLKEFSGKAILVVNVASKCGFTKQYEQLQAVYEKYAPQGFVIVGFPCNDFGGQEPGTNEEIQAFCSSKFNVTFPLMDKVHVKGAEQAPLYAALTGPGAKFPGDIQWNFGKFLIDSKGEVIARWPSKVKPDDAEVIAAIEKALPPK